MPDHRDCRLPVLPPPWSDALPGICDWILATLPARAVLVGGSAVRGDPDRASDFDIHVVNREPWCQRITRFSGTVSCEVFVNPLHHLRERCRDEALAGAPCAAHMVATAAVIWDPEGLAPALQGAARRCLELPPDPLDGPRLARARYAPATDIEDAEDVIARDPDLAALFIGQALPLLLDAHWRGRGRQRPRGKDRLVALAAENPAAAALLRRALGAATVRDRLAAAGELSQRLLAARATFAWESAREAVPEPLPPLHRDLGDGLLLRDTSDTDLPAAFATVAAERDRLGRFLDWVAGTRSLDDVRAFHREQEPLVRAGRARHCSLLHHGTLVGRLSFSAIDAATATGEIGYWCARAGEGRGWMARALSALCAHGFADLGLQRLQLWTHPANQRSQALARRCGFRLEGTFRAAGRLHGQAVDRLWFARLRDEG